MTSKELKRELERLGAKFVAAKGSHFRVYLNDKMSVIPMHNADLGPLEHTIRKQLGIRRSK